MKEYIDDFLKWLHKVYGVSVAKYATVGLDQMLNQFEDSYPHFGEMLDSCYEAMGNAELSDDEIINILTIMAFDNEAESVLEYLENTLTEETLQRFILIGIHHSFFETRWQIAELIHRRKPEGFQEYLDFLAIDEHEYVRKRALKTGDGSPS